jgi:hypothetical protein
MLGWQCGRARHLRSVLLCASAHIAARYLHFFRCRCLQPVRRTKQGLVKWSSKDRHSVSDPAIAKWIARQRISRADLQPALKGVGFRCAAWCAPSHASCRWLPLTRDTSRVHALQVSILTRDRREALLRNKRLRRDPEQAGAAAEDPDAAASITPATDPAAQVQQAVAALQQERRVGSQAHLQALRRLRRLLSTGEMACCMPPHS